MHAMTVGLMGCGNVGGAFWDLIRRTRTHAAAGGHTFRVRRVLVRDPHKRRPVAVDRRRLTADPRALLQDSGIDVVVEAIGGYEPARTYLLQALRAGKHVVTANKVVMARAWGELHRAAAAGGACLHFEAAVGAALPVIESLRGPLAAMPLRSVRGVVNGTTNFVLSCMARGETFAAALHRARQLGYAEPDPADDLDGVDAAYKIALLAALAFHQDADPARVQVTGIRDVSVRQARQAARNGGALRLVASAERSARGGIAMEVAPVRLAMPDPLTTVDGVENAVVVTGDGLGSVTFRGAGAGPGPTAAGLLGDLRGMARAARIGGAEAFAAGGGVADYAD